MKPVDPNNLTHSERTTLVTLRAFRGSMPLADFGGRYAAAGLVDRYGLLTLAGERLADKIAREDGFNITWEVHTD